MIDDATPLEAAIALLESTANLLRGMCMDPTIPVHAREALRQRAEQIDAAVGRRSRPARQTHEPARRDQRQMP